MTRTFTKLIFIVMTLALLPSCAQGPTGLSWGTDTKKETPTYNPNEAAAMAIFQNNCTGCHTPSSGPSGVYDVTDPTHLIAGGLVVKGQPDASSVYTQVNSGAMPPGTPLSAADIATIRNWILGLQ
jgi:mono/diheme cytochrome c family protein